MRISVRRTLYRLRQFSQAIEERRTPVVCDLFDSHLDERGHQFLFALSARDQAHSARTAGLLMRNPNSDPELVTAALLHDVGKGEQELWHRGAYVLIGAVSPRLLRLAARGGPGWRGALHRSLRHSELGAEMAGAAGYGEGICNLIAGHHGPILDARQQALQWADELA